MAEFSADGQSHKNVGRRGAIAVTETPATVGGGQALLNSYQRTRKQSKKKDYVLSEVEEPQ